MSNSETNRSSPFKIDPNYPLNPHGHIPHDCLDFNYISVSKLTSCAEERKKMLRAQLISMGLTQEQALDMMARKLKQLQRHTMEQCVSLTYMAEILDDYCDTVSINAGYMNLLYILKALREGTIQPLQALKKIVFSMHPEDQLDMHPEFNDLADFGIDPETISGLYHDINSNSQIVNGAPETEIDLNDGGTLWVQGRIQDIIDLLPDECLNADGQDTILYADSSQKEGKPLIFCGSRSEFRQHLRMHSLNPQ